LEIAPEKPSVWQVLTNKPFMLLFSAQFVENIGRAVSGLALEILIYELTRSPMIMGLYALVWLSPFVFIAPISGVYTDRIDQRKIMLGSNICSFLASGGFVLIELLRERLYQHIIITEMIGNGVIQITHEINAIHVLWPLFIFSFLNSTAQAFFFPARNAYTRLIIKKKNLMVANSMGQTLFQVGMIIGFVFAGLLTAISYLVSFIFDCSTFLLSAILIVLILIFGRTPPQVERKKQGVKNEIKEFAEDIKIGYRTIRKHRNISYMLVIFAMVTFAAAAINVLFIVILQGEMGLTSTWYGIFQAIMGGASIITSIILMAIGNIKRKILLLNIAFVFATIGIGLFSAIRNMIGMGFIIALLGIAIVCINVPSSTIIQETVVYERQGRVFGSMQLFRGIAQLIGMGLVSILAEFVSPGYVLLGSAVILLITVIAGFIYSSKNGLLEPTQQPVLESTTLPLEAKTDQAFDPVLFEAEAKK
jgi:MFS family permease